MAERPPALSPELRAMLGTYREAHSMPADAKARVHDRLEAAPGGRPAWLWAGVSAAAAALLLWAATSLTGSRQTSTEDGRGSQAAMRATASGSDTAVANQRPEAAVAPPPMRPDIEPPPAEPIVPETSPVEPEPEPEPEPAETTPKLSEPHRRQPKAPREPAEPPPAQDPPEPDLQTPASRLGAENRLIAKTWEHVRAKRYARAKATLREHRATFPNGVLLPERRALEVIIECMANPSAAAGKAEAYATAGRTALLAKVRSACSEKNTAAQ